MKLKNLGFTLVELLIVIALIAILSVAVLATINPIEQSNKARDAKFKNDAAEVLAAYERYYTSLASYPWMNVTTSPDESITDTVVYSGGDAHFGVLDEAGDAGLLVSTSELKSSFMGKEPFESGVDEENKMYVYHNGTTNDNYVCFHPKAAANRATLTNLKCVDDTANTLVDYDGTNCDIPDPWVYTAGAENANLLCVPEGSIQ